MEENTTERTLTDNEESEENTTERSITDDEESEDEIYDQICCQCKRMREFEDDYCRICGHMAIEGCCGEEVAWDCCHCEMKTKNPVARDYCDECGHHRCQDCGEYDQYEFIDLDDTHNERLEEGLDKLDKDDPELVRLLLNTEAEKVARIPPRFALQEGPRSVDMDKLADLFDPAARTAVLSLPANCLAGILTSPGLCGGRNIRAIFNEVSESWTYKTFDPVNQIPWLLHYDRGVLLAEIRRMYQPAPKLGNHTFPYFNYSRDTLVLDFPRCRYRGEDEQENLIRAVREAGRMLTKHQLDPKSPKLLYLQIAYCAFIDTPEQILSAFSSIETLKEVTLQCHDHYALSRFYHGGNEEYRTSIQDDDLAMTCIVNDGDLKGWPWPVYIASRAGYIIESDHGDDSDADDEEDGGVDDGEESGADDKENSGEDLEAEEPSSKRPRHLY